MNVRELSSVSKVIFTCLQMFTYSKETQKWSEQRALLFRFLNCLRTAINTLLTGCSSVCRDTRTVTSHLRNSVCFSETHSHPFGEALFISYLVEHRNANEFLLFYFSLLLSESLVWEEEQIVILVLLQVLLCHWLRSM